MVMFFVMAHGSADAAILAEADLTNNSVINFNGDDTVVLRNGGIVIDVIGQIGNDPGPEWSGGGIGTQNETLRRKSSITEGDTDGADAFDPSIEWDGFAQDTFDGLGSHTVDGGGGGTTLAIAATDANKPEGDLGSTPFTFTVTRSGDTTGVNQVDYTVSGVTDLTVPSDVDSNDFEGPITSGTLVFNVGDTSQDITLNVSGDTTPEIDESFTVTLSNPTGTATISTASANGTIQNDDGITITQIHDIQGTTDTNLLDGNIVTIEGIVVGDFQDGDADTGRNLQGFYVQEEDADADGNALTSEGIFVFEDGNFITDVNVGDLVQVTGTVDESFGETQIDTVTNVTVVSSGNTLPTAASISLPAGATTTNQDGDLQPDIEAFEGMLVNFTDTLTIAEMFQLDRFNEIKLSQGERPEQFTQNNAPDTAGYAAHLEDVGSRTITYDDGLNEQNADIGNLDGFGPNFNTATDIRMGDTIDNLSGVLSYQWAGNSASGATWRVRSTQDGENTFNKVNNRPATPDSVGGDLKVANINVLNYFTTLDEGGNTTANGSNPRGADNATEFDRQTEKLVNTLATMDADVVGLVELENDFQAGSTGNAIENLVDELNALVGAGTYDWVDPGTQFVGDDAIAVGFIYKPGTVSLSGNAAILDTAAFLDPNSSGSNRNRAALAQTFTEIASGESFTATVNHFKSKGDSGLDSDDDGIPDDPTNPDSDRLDGQGYWSDTRADAANALAAWLDTDPTGSGDSDFIILGDLNAYAKEDALTNLEAAGYTDLAAEFLGSDAYSFVFDGQTGTLDYALANSSLRSQVTGTTEWHINVDEPDAIDYNTDFGRDTAIFDGTEPYRASDHDPVIVGLNLSTDTVISGTNETLYDGTTGVTPDNASSTANGQWLEHYNLLLLEDSPFIQDNSSNPVQDETITSNATQLDTTSDNTIYAGYSNYNDGDLNPLTPPEAPGDLVNANFPTLNNTQGYMVNFTIQVNSESNNGNDYNNDGKNDRAGFSAVVVSQDTTKAIELSFETDRIWAQDVIGTTTTDLVQAEGVNYNTNQQQTYNIKVSGDTYTLFAGGTPILSGNLRDYTGVNLGNLPNPYQTANGIFLGDRNDDAGAQVDIYDVSVTTPTSDTTAPTVETFGPADNASAVAVDANLVIDFDENIQAGTGNIVIKQLSDDSVVETIDVTSNLVTISNDTVTINPTADLAEATEYYVEIDAGAIEDTSGNDYTGISGNSSWNFTTTYGSDWNIETVTDFTQDGIPDIFWRNATTGDNHIWLMDSDGTTNAIVNPGSVGVNWQIEKVTDFSNDGVPDILWRNNNTGANSIWLMENNGTLNSESNPGTVGVNWQIEAVTDLSNDGVPDILWRNSTNGLNRIWLMENNGTLNSAVNPGSVGTNWQIETVTDFNEDGVADILWRNGTNGLNRIWLMENNGTLNSAVDPGAVSPNWQVETVTDFSKDGVPDILWRNSTNGLSRIWLMENNGSVNSESNPGPVDPNWQIEAVADFNQDQVPDIFWNNSTNGLNRIWLMENNGTVNLESNPGAVDPNWQIEGVADLSQDGIPDIFWRNGSTGANSIWLMENDGTISSIV